MWADDRRFRHVKEGEYHGYLQGQGGEIESDAVKTVVWPVYVVYVYRVAGDGEGDAT